VVIPQPAASSPAVVMDVSPSSVPSPAPGLLRSREPMILVAAALGVLGMIFTMGIVVGLVFSLHSPETADASGAPRALAAGSVVATSEALPLKVVPVKTSAAPGPADTLAGAKPDAPPAVVATAPSPRSAPVAQVAIPAPRPRPAAVAMATAAPRPAPVAAPAKRQRGSDPDMDAASAASDLAKAQLEASLR
jgi:hypothetical protein